MKSNGPVRAATRFGALRTGKVESKKPRLTKKSKLASSAASVNHRAGNTYYWPHQRSRPRQYLARARTGCAQVLPRTHEVLQEPRAHFRAFARGRRRRSWCVSPRSFVAQPSPFLASDVCAGPIEPARNLTVRSLSSLHRSRPRAGCDRCRRVSTFRPSRMSFPRISRRLHPTRAREIGKASGGEANFQDLLD